MVGQFKSTVICNVCSKKSVCFDPYLLISLPIPSARECYFYFVSSLLEKGALKIMMEYASATTFRGIASEYARMYNNIYYKEVREGSREKVH